MGYLWIVLTGVQYSTTQYSAVQYLVVLLYVCHPSLQPLQVTPTTFFLLRQSVTSLTRTTTASKPHSTLFTTLLHFTYLLTRHQPPSFLPSSITIVIVTFNSHLCISDCLSACAFPDFVTFIHSYYRYPASPACSVFVGRPLALHLETTVPRIYTIYTGILLSVYSACDYGYTCTLGCIAFLYSLATG